MNTANGSMTVGAVAKRAGVSSNIYPGTSVDVLSERIREVVKEHGLLWTALDIITNVIRHG